MLRNEASEANSRRRRFQIGCRLQRFLLPVRFLLPQCLNPSYSVSCATPRLPPILKSTASVLHLLKSTTSGSESVIGMGTFGCGSAIIEGDDFIAENVTFEKNAHEGSDSHKAVAVRVSAKRCAFYNCRFLGFQIK
ncbi:hypothetical protein LXL04_004189 [Taraxacum kok-saghyz]